MTNAAKRIWMGTTAHDARQTAYSRLFSIASAEFGIRLPVVAKAADKKSFSGGRFIYLEPLVPNSFDDSAVPGKTAGDGQSAIIPSGYTAVV